MSRIPRIVCVPRPGSAAAREPGTEVYCVNDTDDTFTVVVGSTAPPTVDEDHGALSEDDVRPASIRLAPGAAERVATVGAGFEAAPLAVEYLCHGTWERERVAYRLDRPGVAYTLDALGLVGRAILPETPPRPAAHPPPVLPLDAAFFSRLAAEPAPAEPPCDDAP